MGRGLGNLRSYVNKQVLGKETHDSRLHVFGYEISHEELGVGLFSKIKRATYKGRDIAVKIMDRDKMPEDFQEKYLSREIEILSDIQHQNIVRIFKIFDYSPKVYIFMELINGETLQEYLQEEGRMEEGNARFFFRQLANAIDYLHAKAIAHRDLKPENIMIHNETIVKIVDFGFAIKLGALDDMSLLVWGHSPYTAPEVILSAYNPLTQDIWSLGAILFNMVTDTTPFSSSDVDMLLEKQIAKDICYPTNLKLSDSLVNILNEMLEPDVAKRATIEEVKECAWLNKDCAVTTSAVEKACQEQEGLE